MSLYDIVNGLLEERGRRKNWLAREIDMTFDGMKNSLIRESMKYNDLVKLCKALEIAPTVLFDSPAPRKVLPDPLPRSAPSPQLKNCEEMIKVYKSQLKDKELIIELLTKELSNNK